MACVYPAERVRALTVAISSSDVPPAPAARESRVRVAAAGDVHAGREGDRERLRAAFASAADRVDVILLAGDLTTHGEPEQAAIVADACRDLEVPVLAVLGNHDWHADRHDELVAALAEGGVDVLERDHRILEIDGTELGVVGTKGFVGGFPGSHLPDFGEPLLRRVYRESVEEAEAIDAGLQSVTLCPLRIVLLHYAPIAATLEGERRDIWAFLGTDRLAAPIAEHTPDLVLHGHAHAGTFAGTLGSIPVHNVSVPVLGQDFWVFEMTTTQRAPSEVH
jgi:Icc-related predicted phosphoesterase